MFNLTAAPETQKSVMCITGLQAVISTERGELVADIYHRTTGQHVVMVTAMTDRELRRSALDAIEFVQAEAKEGGSLV